MRKYMRITGADVQDQHRSDSSRAEALAAHPGGWRIHLNTRKCHHAEGIGLSAAAFTKRAGLQLSSPANPAPAPPVAKKAQD
jgi:hypothetical protein